MNEVIECPVCRGEHGSSCEDRGVTGDEHAHWFKCEVCGHYGIEQSLLWRLKDVPSNLRAVLSHQLRTQQNEDDSPVITKDWLNHLRENGKLPSPRVQAANIIRFMGDEESKSGCPIQFPIGFHAIIGALNRNSADLLRNELIEKKLVKDDVGYMLTLDGWERYEEEKRGQFEGNYGFLAMQFNKDKDDRYGLDDFVEKVLKPIVKNGIGYDLVDMNDVGQAGVIDNILRIKIRDAAFIIADLTHENRGAYWEAGYAEGLRKPVIYICEKRKFEEEKTHFDTNHCTTVPWSRDSEEDFKKTLIATLRRSLNLLPTNQSSYDGSGGE